MSWAEEQLRGLHRAVLGAAHRSYRAFERLRPCDRACLAPGRDATVPRPRLTHRAPRKSRGRLQASASAAGGYDLYVGWEPCIRRFAEPASRRGSVVLPRW